MNAYTDISEFEHVVLEESYVLDIEVRPGVVILELDMVLDPYHHGYKEPSVGESNCCRLGRLRFSGVRRLLWEKQGAPPAVDASGQIDYGHIDSFVWDGDTYQLEGDWGRMELSARHVTLVMADE